MQRPPPEDFSLKETNPLGRGKVSGDMHTRTYDLVEQTEYVYVQVVKARELPVKAKESSVTDASPSFFRKKRKKKDVTGRLDPYVLVKIGKYEGETQHIKEELSPKWNKVFAFSKDRLASQVIQIIVKNKHSVVDEFIGQLYFDLNEVPKRLPPDCPLAPQWYRLEDRRGDKVKGEILLAVWIGTQADDAFPETWHTDAVGIGGTDELANTRSTYYLSPNLWYLRVHVIGAQDLQPSDMGRSPEVCVEAVLGNQVLRTRISESRSINPMWNEDLIFVAAVPFEELLILSVVDIVAPNNNDVLGRCIIPLHAVERRLDHKPINSRWFRLEKPLVSGGQAMKFASTIHVGICLEGGYHVLDESTHYSSDFQPTAKQLRKPHIGLLELGILSAQGLPPMKTRDGRGRTDAYCVAKYGPKWIRTRTIVDSFTPKWAEQHSWELFDPCTVITIGVFDNCHLSGVDEDGPGGDSRIGKVRIRLSTLEMGRVYAHSYPLLVLQPNGVTKMGEIHLAVRLTCTSILDMMYTYSQPQLPKMHYIIPLTENQLDSLRNNATQILSMRLSRAEPPLRKEIVEYMLRSDCSGWNMRQSKAEIFRTLTILSYLVAVGKWFDQICNWEDPFTTVLIYILFFVLVIFPEFVLPAIFLCFSLIGVWRYRWRPRHPPHLDPHLSCVDSADSDELDEEFDSFPTSQPHDIVRMRYDRLRRFAGRIQTVVEKFATECERLESLLSCRDPRATALFATFCLIAAIVLYVTPLRVVALLMGFYVLRPPWFRQKLPSMPLNFFRRLPATTDSMF